MIALSTGGDRNYENSTDKTATDCCLGSEMLEATSFRDCKTMVDDGIEGVVNTIGQTAL